LTEARLHSPCNQHDIDQWERELECVNQELWEIEDRIRDCERQGDFGSGFIELARAVYKTNDGRAALKRRINEIAGSELIEEKSYSSSELGGRGDGPNTLAEETNESLWAIEDGLRDCERQEDFDRRFVKLARAVHRTNDCGAEIRREINLSAGTNVIEKKSYWVSQSEAVGRPDGADQTATPRSIKPAFAPVPSGGTIPGYVISLARRPDRRDRFMRWNSRKGIDISVFDAVDGQTLSKQELLRSNIIDDEHINFTMGFLGSAMSHRALWQKCVELRHAILIFEDDVFLPDSLRDWSEQVCYELANGCDILYLGYNRDAIISLGYGDGAWCNIAFQTSTTAFDDEAQRHNQWSGRNSHCVLDAQLAWGITAYAISPQSARSLLSHCFPLSNKHRVRMDASGRLLVPYSLDGIINVAVQRGLIKSRVVFPPLVIGPNEPSDSDNYAKPR